MYFDYKLPFEYDKWILALNSLQKKASEMSENSETEDKIKIQALSISKKCIINNYYVVYSIRSYDRKEEFKLNVRYHVRGFASAQKKHKNKKFLKCKQSFPKELLKEIKLTTNHEEVQYQVINYSYKSYYSDCSNN